MAFVDFTRLERPGSPNTYLVAPQGLCAHASPDAVPPRFSQSPPELFALAEKVIRSQFRPVQIEIDAGRLALHVVAATPLLRFKDDVDLLVVPDGEGATLAIYSRSRVGYSDLGANAKRVGKLLESLMAAAQTT